MHIHKAGFGAHGGWHQTRQDGVLEVARDAPTGRHKGLEGRVMLVIALEHAGGGVGDIVDARAGESLFIEQGDGFMQLAASVFEVGRRAAHPGDQTPEYRGNRVTRPGIRHRYPHAAGGLQRRGAGGAVMVMGIDGQNS